MNNRALGVCIGASTVSAVILYERHNKIEVESVQSIPHHGNPKEIIEYIFSYSVPSKVVATGKKFKTILNLKTISEAEAVEICYNHFNYNSEIIISAGGENFLVYVTDNNGKISKVLTGNKCASGTGEFFLQQLKRMNIDIDDVSCFSEVNQPYNISGRCSVFCKSDCTHALNKGVAKENVVAGLSRMMANKIIELTSRIPYQSALIIGGTTKNKGVMKFLKAEISDLIIPKEAPYFEAFGAALYALQNDIKHFNKDNLFNKNRSSFQFHDELKKHIAKVTFKEVPRGNAAANDICILGLDVGSTTTKIVLLRNSDSSILASEYLRTNGDPIKASIECYKSIKNQIDVPIKIIGLGVTGSGRQISGLHALTKGIINEIIAHATATVFFDAEVDTIFEIGGQDAKYTYITSGIASDYAMNEACSAGTGSFLEEAAKESLAIDFTEIGNIAMNAMNPPNFNDQCSAFIGSDIKNALHEGLSKDDIIAGLVYSICMNFINRVKGNRPVGKKVFMQGGVCYNKAVPIAMAALTGKEIIVPPEPGLMGAFGVALEIKNRIELGLLKDQNYYFDELINRTVEYDKDFICYGGKEDCDRKCNVSLIKIEGKKYPFGGACNKYYNLQLDVKKSSKQYDLVNLRQKLVFEKYIHPVEFENNVETIGISKSFFTNTLYPLFYNFFTQLGFKIILGDESNPAGIEKRESAFCYPVELAHGFFQNLIDKKPDYIFIPHITEIFTKEKNPKKTCVFVQAESYFLQTTFKNDLNGIRILNPVLNFSEGYQSEKASFVNLAVELGKDKVLASAAFDFSISQLDEMLLEFSKIGNEFLKELEQNEDEFAIVLFGRSYNSFPQEANLGIPRKFSSRNVRIIPYDFLPIDDFESYKHMYWGTGQQLLKAARLVHSHKQLFGTFITNFSCGPDSFIIGYFRNLMKNKPSLTLELDSHSADAGINTRIEAAIDIIKSYLQLEKKKVFQFYSSNYKPLEVTDTSIIDSYGNKISLKNKNVKMIIPSMGNLSAQAFASAFNYIGINSEALPVSTTKTLITGRGNSTCKECVPLILNAGSLVQYYERKNPDEITLFFMAAGNGPCRFGQYQIFLEDLIRKKEMRNIGIFTLSDENSYDGLGNEFIKRGWASLTIADVMKNIFNAIQALAVNKNLAIEIFNNEWKKIITKLEKENINKIYLQLEESAVELSKIELKCKFEESKKIALIGEIYVRHDEFTKIDLLQRLAEKEFVVQIAPIGEYVYYSNYLASKNIHNDENKYVKKLKFAIRDYEQIKIEKRIKNILSQSGLVKNDLYKIEEVIERAEHLISPELEGEAILTIGTGLKEIMEDVCGVISIGPFGCMPSRVAESILNVEMNSEGKAKSKKINSDKIKNENYPFLSIETDGNIFPQIIQTKIEIFMLQAERMHFKIFQQNENIKPKFWEIIAAHLKSYYEKWGLESKETLPSYEDV